MHLGEGSIVRIKATMYVALLISLVTALVSLVPFVALGATSILTRFFTLDPAVSSFAVYCFIASAPIIVLESIYSVGVGVLRAIRAQGAISISYIISFYIVSPVVMLVLSTCCVWLLKT